MMNNYSAAINNALGQACLVAHAHETNRLTIEMLLLGIVSEPAVFAMLEEYQPQIRRAVEILENHIRTRHYEREKIVDGILYTDEVADILLHAYSASLTAGSDLITLEHVIMSIYYAKSQPYAREWLEEYVMKPQGMDARRLALIFREPLCNQVPEGDSLAEEIPYCRPIPRMGDKDWRLVGRGEELSRLMGVLCRMERPNPILIGDHGVGKSAIVYGLDALIRSGMCPRHLKGKRILQFNLPEVMAGAIYRGDLEQRLTAALDAAVSDGGVILFIDKIHDIVGAGKFTDSTIDVTSLLVPYIESRRIAVVGATTYPEYRKAAGKCPYLESLFQRVDIAEPSAAEAVEVLTGLAPSLERFHGVRFLEGTIPFAVNLGGRFSRFGRLPGSAFCLLDEAGVMAGMEQGDGGEVTVSRDHLKAVFSRLSGIDITGDDLEDIRQLKDRLRERVFGQDEAIDVVSDAICASKVGLGSSEKPIASLLFVGTTGVGKTFLARELARLLGLPLKRLDMSEYSENNSVARLIGTSAGYIGYDEGGQLTNLVQDTPHCVLLLDEMEKAHEKVYNLLLQVMDAGALTDGHGRKTDFRHVILIMTSNAGARDAARTTVGFTPGVRGVRSMTSGIREVFPPEFINRLTAQVIFRSMDEKMARSILDERLAELERMLLEKSISLECTPEASEGMLKKGYSPEYGAREFERVIGQEVKPLIVKEILYGGLDGGGKILIRYEGGRFACSATATKKGGHLKRMLGLVG